MTEAAITQLLGMGFPGTVILALAIAYRNKDKKLEETNEKRVSESREAIKIIEQSTNTIETLTEVVRGRGN
jgi:hypothetical protein